MVKSHLSINDGSSDLLKQAAQSQTEFGALLRSQFNEEWASDEKLQALVQRVNSLDNALFNEYVRLYNTPQEGLDSIAKLLLGYYIVIKKLIL
jgi:hypothetical protein